MKLFFYRAPTRTIMYLFFLLFLMLLYIILFLFLNPPCISPFGPDEHEWPQNSAAAPH